MAGNEFTCLWRMQNGQDCGKPAVSKVTLKGRLGAGRVPVCREHRAEHNRKAAAFRKESS